MVMIDRVRGRSDDFQEAHTGQQLQCTETRREADQKIHARSVLNRIDRRENPGEYDVRMETLGHYETENRCDQNLPQPEETAIAVCSEPPKKERQQVGGVMETQDILPLERPIEVKSQREREHQHESGERRQG